jgi:hypothetical protein
MKTRRIFRSFFHPFSSTSSIWFNSLLPIRQPAKKIICPFPNQHCCDFVDWFGCQSRFDRVYCQSVCCSREESDTFRLKCRLPTTLWLVVERSNLTNFWSIDQLINWLINWLINTLCTETNCHAEWKKCFKFSNCFWDRSMSSRHP